MKNNEKIFETLHAKKSMNFLILNNFISNVIITMKYNRNNLEKIFFYIYDKFPEIFFNVSCIHSTHINNLFLPYGLKDIFSFIIKSYMAGIFN